MEKGHADSLKYPYGEERPKRRGNEIGKGGDCKEYASGNHKGFCRYFQERLPDKGFYHHGRDADDPDEQTNFRF